MLQRCEDKAWLHFHDDLYGYVRVKFGIVLLLVYEQLRQIRTNLCWNEWDGLERKTGWGAISGRGEVAESAVSGLFAESAPTALVSPNRSQQIDPSEIRPIDI